jgi:glycosyltransferase involved in cell wall biosynthesis
MASLIAEVASLAGTPKRRVVAAEDPEIELLVPHDDIDEPELSIVVPALNEQLTIGDFVAWCHEGLAKAGVKGEVLIVDSSADKTPEIAISLGARVLKTPKRGLGRAYLDAIPFIRGRYVVMGDCDCTYDFRELVPFVEKFRGGAEFVMGSRFRGYIEPGSMPPLHRYLGTPVTTWILNVIFSSKFSDIHCGMRGITLDALKRMDLRSQSWEYASEMVLKSVHLGLRTEEVPIRFLKDREHRLSHHKRMGWFSPWQAAWINLRAMFVYGPDFFLYKPGIVALVAGLALLALTARGPFALGPITLSLHWMLLGLSLAILGLQSTFSGILAQVLHDPNGRRSEVWLRRFPYTRSAAVSGGLFLLGLVPVLALLRTYVNNGYRLFALEATTHLAVVGLFLLIAGFALFGFTLLLHAAVVSFRRR